jgi:Ca2+-binding RTX toxin-like protein
VTLDVQNWRGLKEVAYQQTDRSGTLKASTASFNSKGNVSAFTARGTTTLDVDDRAASGAKALTDLTLEKVSGRVMVGQNSPTSIQKLTLIDSAPTTIYITAENAPRKLDVIYKNSLEAVSIDAIQDDQATSVSFTIAGKDLALAYGSFAKATSIDIASDVQFTLENMVAEQCATMRVTGSGHVNVTGRSLAAGHLIDATGSTGGVTVRQHISDSLFKGGAGADLVYFDKELQTKNSLGAGNDIARFDTGILVWRDPNFYALGDNAEVDGGEGIDTLSLDFYDAPRASAGDALGTSFVSKVKGFEILELLTSQTTFFGSEIKIDNLNRNGANAIQEIAFAGQLSGSGQEYMTLSGLKNGTTLSFKASVDVPRIIASLADRDGNQDSLNIKIIGDQARMVGPIVADGVETIRIALEDTGAGSSPVTHILKGLEAGSAREILLTGAGLQLDSLATAAEVRIDASGVTKTGVKISMTADQQQGGVTMIGSDFADTLTGGVGRDVISGGKGNDIINMTGSRQKDVVTGGDGADQFVFEHLQSSSGTAGIVHITDFVAGTDKIKLQAYSGVHLNSEQTLASADSLAEIYAGIQGTPRSTTQQAEARVITVSQGAAKGTYLFVNDSDAGISASNDMLVNITGMTGHLSSSDFIH